MSHVKPNREYSRAEYISDAVVHGLGIGGALIAGPVLVTLAAIWIGDPGLVTALGVYAFTLLAMWVCSALYNLVQREDLVSGLRRLDQSAIYFKIAGTYTPFIALASGSLGFLAGIWAVALAGASLIILSPGRVAVLAIALYLALGWAGAVLGGPLVSTLSPLGFWLLVAGGLTYSAGVVFNVWGSLPFHNTIWHVFVLVGTVFCYAAIATEVALAA
ncbi:hemolysin III family protein [Hasllibacter sp. MH4015]|uniref:PAQR family membrane homeostasis protein TrhA n=1 Tax=Hasllibacter sp. MH4015 TaxID=2854029 RepID=UPI001CD80176|nr:hemolysin III family protein [Hasllibacter sp. MH4015]